MWFSKTDLKEAFYQIRIRRKDAWKTAFWTRYGTFEYLVLFFELMNVSAIFQQHINQVLKEELNQKRIGYMNDILIIGKIRKEYRAKIRRILTILEKTELRTKRSKCEFEKKEIIFLEYCIERERIHSMKEKLQILRE